MDMPDRSPTSREANQLKAKEKLLDAANSDGRVLMGEVRVGKTAPMLIPNHVGFMAYATA